MYSATPQPLRAILVAAFQLYGLLHAFALAFAALATALLYFDLASRQSVPVNDIGGAAAHGELPAEQ